MDTITPPRPFLARHEFLIRRLHSLSGLIPVGAFMTVHLLANSSLLEGPGTFQRAVYQIHSLGGLLPLVEWVFIFGPILFHGLLGLVIILSGRRNTTQYPYPSNIRYTVQRWAGLFAFAFILWHVFHMHGWFHVDFWVKNVVEPLGGAQFRPFNASSTLGAAMQGVLIPLLYAVGVLSCVFHLANGIWTMGITWGLWIAPAAQRRATWISAGLGGLLAMIAMVALFAATNVDIPEAVDVEDAMYRAKIESCEIRANEEKRAVHGRSLDAVSADAASGEREPAVD